MNDIAATLDVGQLDRRTYLGSSDVAAILGLSKWKTPLDVYLEKLGQGVPPDAAKEKLFRRGKRLEPVVLDMLGEEYGYEITARGARYRDPGYSWMAAEIDAETVIDGETVNIEVKTVHPFAAGEWGEMETDEIPIHYAAQAMYGLMITGRQRCIFAALFGADNLVTYDLRRDEETIDGIRAKAIAFWLDHVLAKVPPEPIVLEDALRLMRRDVNLIVQADKALGDQVYAYKAAKAAERVAQERIKELQFQIAVALLGPDVASMPSRKPKHVIVVDGEPALALSYQEQNRIDSEAVRSRHPDVAAECSKTSKFFRFDLPRSKR
jgi:putative phage-type endonuclease